MNIFADTNVLMTVMLPEMSRFDAAARVLTLTRDSRNKIYTTAMALGNCFFMLEKKYGHAHAKQKISTAAEHLFIAPCDEPETRNALSEKRVNDFEDRLQYFAALRAECNCIVTYDNSGFYYASMPVLKPEDFLSQYNKQRL